MHRPAHPAAPQTPAGGINPAPTNKFCVSGQTGWPPPTRTTVGRDAPIPPHPAPPQTPAGGINPAPTNEFCVSGQTGTAATHPGVRRAGCPHPAVSHGGANVSILNRQCAAGVNARPTKPETCGGQPGNRGPALQQTPVGADSISAREPRGGANAPGGYGIRPYGRRRAPGRPGSDIPALQQTSVGDDACIVPRTSRRRKHPGRDLRPKSRRCAAVGLRNAPAGAVNPAPTNKFCVSGQPDGGGICAGS